MPETLFFRDDELDDFIEYDDEQMVNREERVANRQQRLREMRERSKDIEASLGISKDAWLDIQEIFGDGTEYDYALYAENDAEEDDLEPNQKVPTLDKVNTTLFHPHYKGV